jgi:hypothetical protein
VIRVGRPVGRVIALVVVGLLAAGAIYALRSPLTISESEVRQLVKRRTLIGLPLEEAGTMLQHKVPGTVDGVVVLDFKQVRGWKAGPLTLDVRFGQVTAATWGEPQAEE